MSKFTKEMDEVDKAMESDVNRLAMKVIMQLERDIPLFNEIAHMYQRASNWTMGGLLFMASAVLAIVIDNWYYWAAALIGWLGCLFMARSYEKEASRLIQELKEHERELDDELHPKRD